MPCCSSNVWLCLELFFFHYFIYLLNIIKNTVHSIDFLYPYSGWLLLSSLQRKIALDRLCQSSRQHLKTSRGLRRLSAYFKVCFSCTRGSINLALLLLLWFVVHCRCIDGRDIFHFRGILIICCFWIVYFKLLAMSLTLCAAFVFVEFRIFSKQTIH